MADPVQATGPTNSGVLMDNAVRDAVRAETPEGRKTAVVVSDVGDAVMVGYPFLVDNLVLTGIARGDWRQSGRMFLVDGLASGASFGTIYVMKKLIGRDRPLVPECRADGKYDSYCGTAEETMSFPSGHSSSAFTGAAQTCMHALSLDLYGESTAAKATTCSLAFAGAGTVATLRMVADKHWSTDVLVGAVIGTAVGFAVPALIGYGERKGNSPELGMPPAPTLTLSGTF